MIPDKQVTVEIKRQNPNFISQESLIQSQYVAVIYSGWIYWKHLEAEHLWQSCDSRRALTMTDIESTEDHHGMPRNMQLLGDLLHVHVYRDI